MLRIICALMVITAAMAADDPLAEARAAAEGVERLSVTFTLERHLALFPEPVQSRGRLLIDRRANAVRWHFEDEVTLILVDDQLRRWGPDGDEEPVDLAHDPGARALKQQMSAFRDGDWSRLNELFESRVSDDGRVVFTPRGEDLARVLARVELELGAAGAPRELVIASANGDRTIYRFDEADIDPTADPAQFTGP